MQESKAFGKKEKAKNILYKSTLICYNEENSEGRPIMTVYSIPCEGRVFELQEAPWEGYREVPRTSVCVSYSDTGFHLRFVSYETRLRAVETKHNTPVCCDSCVEAFLQFSPATDPHYINIEINPNAAVYCAVRTSREDATLMSDEAIERLAVHTTVFSDRWETELCIPVDFIREYIPTYRHGEGSMLRANFYKCGDMTETPHYGAFAPIQWQTPDFHRPEFFADFLLV